MQPTRAERHRTQLRRAREAKSRMWIPWVVFPVVIGAAIAIAFTLYLVL
jgi:hypothetical protein